MLPILLLLLVRREINDLRLTIESIKANHLGWTHYVMGMEESLLANDRLLATAIDRIINGPAQPSPQDIPPN